MFLISYEATMAASLFIYVFSRHYVAESFMRMNLLFSPFGTIVFVLYMRKNTYTLK